MFFHTALFENFLPHSVSVAAAKNQPAQGLGTPQNRPWAKKSIFSKSEISITYHPRKFRGGGAVNTAIDNSVGETTFFSFLH